MRPNYFKYRPPKLISCLARAEAKPRRPARSEQSPVKKFSFPRRKPDLSIGLLILPVTPLEQAYTSVYARPLGLFGLGGFWPLEPAGAGIGTSFPL
jgi:hypothetical protein